MSSTLTAHELPMNRAPKLRLVIDSPRRPPEVRWLRGGRLDIGREEPVAAR